MSTIATEVRINYEHRQLVKTLTKTGEDIIKGLTPEKADLWHVTSALMGEAGELFDAAKKFAVYGKALTPEMRAHMIEELGDMEFYMERIRYILVVSREDTLSANMAKLAARYQGKYSDAAAQARADKVQETGDYHRE